jgi:hypothetical protein
MRSDHAREKFYLATLGLATGVDEIHERLIGAAITLSVLRPQEVPVNIRDDFQKLWSELTSHPAEIPGEGTIQATVRDLDSYDARGLAERVFEMYFAVLGITPFGHPREAS